MLKVNKNTWVKVVEVEGKTGLVQASRKASFIISNEEPTSTLEGIKTLTVYKSDSTSSLWVRCVNDCIVTVGAGLSFSVASASDGGGLVSQHGGMMVYNNNAVSEVSPLTILQNNEIELNMNDFVNSDSHSLLPDDIKLLPDGYLDKVKNGLLVGGVVGRTNVYVLELGISNSTEAGDVELKGKAIVKDGNDFDVTGGIHIVRREVTTDGNIVYHKIQLVMFAFNSDYYVNDLEVLKIYIKATDGDAIISDMVIGVTSNNVNRPSTV